MPSLSLYNASKWAVEGFSEALLFELKPFDIDVVLIEPGNFKTRIFTDNLKLAQHAKSSDSPYYHFSSIAFNKLQKKIQERLQDPKKVARLCARILAMKHPKFRYIIGMDARLRNAFRRLLPFELYRLLVNAVFRRIMR